MAIAMKYWPVTFVLNVSAHCESSLRRKCWLMAFASVMSGWPLVAVAVLGHGRVSSSIWCHLQNLVLSSLAMPALLTSWESVRKAI